jgi:hypothetical protein
MQKHPAFAALKMKLKMDKPTPVCSALTDGTQIDANGGELLDQGHTLYQSEHC